MKLKPIIMVVDDDPGMGKLLTAFLGKHNYEVNYFCSPKKALGCLNLLKDADNGVNPVRSEHSRVKGAGNNSNSLALDAFNGVNLLLTDLRMPEMTGIELARQAKALFPAMPVIVMSGSADGRQRDGIFALGADFIAKPFELADLLRRIDSRIIQSGMEFNNPISVK